ncbi:hypothetical protein [Synechococcus sp. CC9616]|uniref:hypothetical protein n=1 Tax=Synechococcus sp. CC9616 TaxID=110663 RepID=UPI00048E4C3A|nr:hypothetical protein [Synechococcus sp. CC9616]
MFCRLAWSTLAAVILTPGLATGVAAQVETPFQNREERAIYGGGESSDVLDATNPMDLINRLRQSGMMDDATPPSDAVDAALKAFEASPGAVQAP